MYEVLLTYLLITQYSCAGLQGLLKWMFKDFVFTILSPVLSRLWRWPKREKEVTSALLSNKRPSNWLQVLHTATPLGGFVNMRSVLVLSPVFFGQDVSTFTQHIDYEFSSSHENVLFWFFSYTTHQDK